MSVAAHTRPGRHRSQAADDAILAAAVQLLQENGYSALTMASVIERAGVSSATVYRRFTDKDDLVVAAFASLVPEPVDIDTGTLVGDLTAFARHKADAMIRKSDLADIAGECQRNPELAAIMRQKFLVPSQAQLGEILARAKARGEITTVPAADLAYALLIGPLHYRGIVLRELLTDAFIGTVVGHALDGFSS